MNSERNVDLQFSKVCEKAERLFKVDQEIEEITNFTVEEYDTKESYRDRFIEIRIEEHRVLAENAFRSSPNLMESHEQVQLDEPTATTLVVNTHTGKISCIFCDRPHSSQDCQKMSNKSYEDRKSEIMRRRCCLVGLKPGHPDKDSGLKSPEFPGSSPPAPNPVPEVSRFARNPKYGCFASFLQSHDGRALESKIGFEILSDFSHQPLERQFTDQQLGVFLVTTDFSQSYRSGPVTMRFLHNTGCRGALTSSLVGQMLPVGFTPGTFSSGLLGTCHCLEKFAVL
ncbi:uncharacterized protein TNIN_382041 [Trichonephila inaurata madagascariensis]|uniref:Uncharacterized protein n=1 Tax=Trichonephila inaurata madagascariensis TaxID=2747483 RepID=A0A8X6IHJ9_9ARAC|nr:uncharacterized protein TNIN_382041 [Trichonephila inaurata madagascariensis]